MNNIIYTSESIRNEIRRGDMYYLDISWEENGKIFSKERPVLIISGNINNRINNNIIYVKLTSNLKKSYMPSNVLISGYGLKKESLAQCDKIGSDEKRNLKSYVGTVSNEVMKKIEQAFSYIGLKFAA